MADLSPPALVLASGSSSRRQVLEAAGLIFRIVPADIDERALEPPPTSDGDHYALTVARSLAAAKACEVSLRLQGALVIGADQTLHIAGGHDLLHKPADLAGAAAQLRLLRGHTHWLTSAVALAQDGVVLWSHEERARMTMRDFGDAFLNDYLAAVGPAVATSVGCYQLEGLGIQLFERIDGDYFTILGLPLLPLLAELRRRKVIPT